ncbi:MAG TPA: hypothetical protein V6D20_09810 [Candidatus Obscuribacterales bacterium]
MTEPIDSTIDPPSQPVDILILSNGPGEVATWVRPVVQALRHVWGGDRSTLRLSVILSPCANASGREAAIVQSYPEVDRVQGATDFFPFLLWGKTAENWDWRDRGVVVFLGGDQIFPVVIGRRLGYKTLIYGEWDTRWHGWIDRFAVMKADLCQRAPIRHRPKFTVVGDLMAEAGTVPALETLDTEHIGLLPGSKPAKLAQGVPLCLAIAQQIHRQRPHARFILPVAPTLDLETLAHFADPSQNAIAAIFHFTGATLHSGDPPYLETQDGLQITLIRTFPAYETLAQCQLCLTTIGANTAELGALTIPMIVMLPTQQLDAMRAWDGIPGLFANLPGVGSLMAKLINGWFLRKPRLLAWPNIWAGKEIVPELVGSLEPQQVAKVALEYLNDPQQLTHMRQQLRAARGQPGAAKAIAHLTLDLLNHPHPS